MLSVDLDADVLIVQGRQRPFLVSQQLYGLVQQHYLSIRYQRQHSYIEWSESHHLQNQRPDDWEQFVASRSRHHDEAVVDLVHLVYSELKKEGLKSELNVFNLFLL